LIDNIIIWAKKDYTAHPIRFIVEISAWIMSIGAALWFALTVPNVPFIWYLLLTVASCGMYAWAAWTRGSAGMLANYLLLFVFDSIGLIRIIMQQLK
jgi:hypothetical protein